MRDARGFTILEAIVGMGILIVAILGTMSFFIFGSQRTQESFRHKNVEEILASVASLISNDIQRAGFGLFPNVGTAYPQLGLFVIDGGTGVPNPLPDQLYVNYSNYLSLESNPQAPPSENNSPTCSYQYRSINSVFTRPDKAFTCGPYTLYYQGFVSLAVSNSLDLLGVPASLSFSDIGAVLAVMADGTGAVAASPATCAARTATPLCTLPGTENWTLSFASSGKNATGGTQTISAGWVAVPAIRYHVEQATTQNTGRLLRNGAPIMGGDPYLDVTNLQVTCFAGGAWQTMNAAPALLRMVEINISYRVNRGKGDAINWTPVYSRTLRVTPRTIVLKQTVG